MQLVMQSKVAASALEIVVRVVKLKKKKKNNMVIVYPVSSLSLKVVRMYLINSDLDLNLD